MYAHYNRFASDRYCLRSLRMYPQHLKSFSKYIQQRKAHKILLMCPYNLIMTLVSFQLYTITCTDTIPHYSTSWNVLVDC